MRKKKIKKGNHYSFSIPCIHFNKKSFSYLIEFTDSCKYDIGKNQYDINKLFGLSYGLHHNNSARFGWRWNPKKNSIDIISYVYINGERIKDNSKILITDVKLNVPFIISFKVENEYYSFTVFYNDKKYNKKIKHGSLPFWGYKLNPYFGGKISSPHDIIIKYSYLKSNVFQG